MNNHNTTTANESLQPTQLDMGFDFDQFLAPPKPTTNNATPKPEPVAEPRQVPPCLPAAHGQHGPSGRDRRYSGQCSGAAGRLRRAPIRPQALQVSAARLR